MRTLDTDVEWQASQPGGEQDLATGSADSALNRPGWRTAHRDRGLFGLLLLGTALLYLIGLSVSGWANEYYSAAAQAGSKSWTAFLFGSLDSSNFITVDKPPASLWVMDLSVRVFGLSSWSILAPQALEGVAAVALLYAAVKRVSTPTAALFAGAILATTPVATLMFRYNNPDALLVLLMTAAAYATIRASEAGRGRWLVLAGTLLGFAFLTKMMQGLLVVPAFATAYLVAAPTSLRTRIKHLLAGGAALIVAAGWWVALVVLWPAGSRPYVGGSNHNSILELIFGYDGVGRLDGSSNNGNVSGGTGGFSSSQTGLSRLFGSDMGSQISWLLPAALVSIGALIWLTWRRPRTDALRTSTIVWGGWLLVTGVILSFASGIIHPYYTVALAPAIAAVLALAVTTLWERRADPAARWLLAGVVGAGVLWSFDLLGRSSWAPWLRWVVLLSGTGALVAVLTPKARAVVVAPLIACAMLIAPTAYALQTASTSHSGALPTAGPTTTTGFGGGRTGGGRPGGFAGGRPGGTTGGAHTGANTGGTFGGGTPPNGASNVGGSTTGSSSTGPPTGGLSGAGGAHTGGGGGQPGGLGGATTISSALTSALKTEASGYTWVAATTGANEAASLELATGDPVAALGGYNGTDPALSLAGFKTLVAKGKIHYYVTDPSGFIGSTAADTSTAYAIQQWVETTYTASTVGGTTVYDLTK